MNEEDLFVEPVPAVEPLARKHDLVLRAVVRMQGLSADEAGQVVHADAGKHAADETCSWCGWEGGRVLKALEAKSLVVSRNGHWTAT
jgi:hypothetical protein